MSSFGIAILFGIGVSGWAYAQLAKRNGNASPGNNLIAAVAAGVVVTIILFTVLKFSFNFN